MNLAVGALAVCVFFSLVLESLPHSGMNRRPPPWVLELAEPKAYCFGQEGTGAGRSSLQVGGPGEGEGEANGCT